MNEQHIAGTHSEFSKSCAEGGNRFSGAVEGEGNQLITIEETDLLEGKPADGGIEGNHYFGDLLVGGDKRMLLVNRIGAGVERPVEQAFKLFELDRRITHQEKVAGLDLGIGERH